MQLRLERDPAFYRNILSIALPVALQNLITMGTSMMDSVMLGRADDTGVLLSASTLANQPFFILTMLTFGLSGACSVLCAQYWGKREMAPIRAVLAHVTRLGCLLGLLSGLLVLFFPETVMSLYTERPEVIAAGADYLRILGFAYCTFGISSTMICSLRGVELVRISVVVGALSFCTNVFLNWVLIFGNLGAPAMGIRGAALATLCARLLEFVIVVVYVFVIDNRVNFRVRDLFSFHRVLGLDLLRTGTPVVLNELCWSVTMSVQAAILGHIAYAAGDPVAANSIASIIQQLSTTFVFGVSSAAAVLVGKAIGEADFVRARRQARTFQLLSVGIGLAAFCLILLIRDPFLSIYDLPQATLALARQLVLVTAFVTFFTSTTSTMLVGILRGAGDVNFGMLAEAGALWLIATPLAFLAAGVLHLPVPAVLLCMKSDEFVKSVLCVLRLRGDKWIVSLTRENV